MAFSDDAMSKHMSGYKAACEEHPELKSFDASLQQRTKNMIDSLTGGANSKDKSKSEIVSQHKIHMELSQQVFDATQDVANFILASKDDVWENIPLRSLVKTYFANSMKTLKIFDNIMKCVDKAKLGHHYLQEAVAQFDKEAKDVGGKRKKYEETLKELKKFTDMQDPFNGVELTAEFKSMIELQDSLLKKVADAKTELDKEVEKVAADLASKKNWSFLSNVILGAAGFLSIVGGIALMATGVGAPAGIALVGVGFVVIVPGWVGVQFYLDSRKDALKRQQEGLKKLNEQLESVDKGLRLHEGLDSISEEAFALEEKIKLILTYADDAINNEENEVITKQSIDDIRNEEEDLIEDIKELGKCVAHLRKKIHDARSVVIDKISAS